MKVLNILVSSILLFSISCATSNKYSVSSSYEIPRYKELELKNGLKVLLIPDKKLPSLSFMMMVKSGAVDDEADTIGVSSLTASLIGKSSTSQSAMQLADKIAYIGSSFDGFSTMEASWFQMAGMTQYEDEMLDIFTDVLLKPSFDKRELRRVKQERIAGIKQLIDNPSSYSSFMFKKNLFGSHPYGRSSVGTIKSLSKVKRADIYRYYLKYYRPNNSYLAVVGNYSSNIIEKLEKNFASWKVRKIEDTVIPEIKMQNNKNITLLVKNDLSQTQIRIGHIGPKRKIENYLALKIANTILGNGFGSRLVEDVRVKKGLTYSISSDFDFMHEAGEFTISTFTRHEKTAEVIKSVQSVILDFKQKGVTEEEVESAKNYILGNLPQALETGEKLAFNLLNLRSYEVSDDYLKDYVKNIAKINTEEVNASIKKYINPESMQILVYSNYQTQKQLKDLGKFKIEKAKIQ